MPQAVGAMIPRGYIPSPNRHRRSFWSCWKRDISCTELVNRWTSWNQSWNMWLWQVVTSLVSQNFKYTIHTIIFSWWDVKNVKSSWCRSKKLEKKKRRLFIVEGMNFCTPAMATKGTWPAFCTENLAGSGHLEKTHDVEQAPRNMRQNGCGRSQLFSLPSGKLT